MNFIPVQGPPFVREGDVRREGTFDDFCRFLKLAQVYDDFDTAGGLPCEPNDLPLDSRHLDMQLALLTLTDKPYGGAQVSLDCALDSLALAGMAFGGAEALAREPVMYSVVNVNSPLLYDGRMLDALLAYAAAGQPVVVTPFLLMGAMSPVSIPSALVQQTAEALGRRRADAARTARDAGGPRLVPLAHRHAVGLARLRRAGVGDRALLLGADRAAASTCRGARAAARSRAASCPTPRPPTRASTRCCRRSSPAPTS